MVAEEEDGRGALGLGVVFALGTAVRRRGARRRRIFAGF
jgi:hypothetical protein